MSLALDVLAEPRRREILRLLWDRETPAGAVAARLPITFGAVSQHLRVLREAGLVTRRREGRQRLYRARREALGPLAEYLENLWRGHLGDLKRLAEADEKGDTP